jgi:hypothetical protein
MRMPMSSAVSPTSTNLVAKRPRRLVAGNCSELLSDVKRWEQARQHPKSQADRNQIDFLVAPAGGRSNERDEREDEKDGVQHGPIFCLGSRNVFVR